MGGGLNVRRLAECDVRFLDRADNTTVYTDFRRVMDRKDIDLVAIATPPHWHALITIAAHAIGQGRPVREAVHAYHRRRPGGRQRGETVWPDLPGRHHYGIGAAGNPGNGLTHKIMTSGLLGTNCQGVHILRGGLKVRELERPGRPAGVGGACESRLGHVLWEVALEAVRPAALSACTPPQLLGLRRRRPRRHGATSSRPAEFCLRAKDDTSPVEIEAVAPPQDPEVSGMWAWVELKYADGFTLVLDSGEWGPRYDRKASRGISINDLSAADQATVRAMPDPPTAPSLSTWPSTHALRQSGGHPEAAHRTATILHLANIAFRLGRKIRFDPVREQIVGDEEANLLANPPMRAPWHL